MRKPMRLMLCQLGVQYRSFGSGQPHLSVPLALGYLVSGLDAAGLLQSCKVNILGPDFSLYAADAAIINEILKYRPAVVGFSCYCWNIRRTLFIASGLKAQQPDIFIVLGGPEATENSGDILSKHLYISAVVRGEGEEAFPRLIAGLLEDNLPVGIPGLSIRLRGMVHHSPQLAYVTDIGRYPSPYEKGYLDIGRYGSLNIETVRGCIFHCDYCYYPKQFTRIRAFDLDRLKREVKLAAKAGISKGYLMDPVFNLPGRVGPLCRAIADGNEQGQISFQTEARAELIRRETAELFYLANIRSVEIGLQTTNQAALRHINRTFSPGSFSRAVETLQKAGIHVRVGIITGLPGDRIIDVEHTLDFLMELGIEDIQCFLLQVLPGTRLRARAGELGLVYMPEPPYYIIQNRELSEEEIHLVYAYARKRIRLLSHKEPYSPDLTMGRAEVGLYGVNGISSRIDDSGGGV
jgi:radical SAM superfamily enzyme YgiQ (UPF0313 family)